MSQKRSTRLLWVPVLLACAVLLAFVLNNQATHGSHYLGLPTVPCIDPAKTVHQNYQLTIRVSENGSTVPLPADLGHDFGNCLHSIHTDDATGRVRVESNYDDQLTLGQFFDVWKKTFNDHQIGDKTVVSGHSLTVAVGGQTYTTDLRSVPLKPDATITVVLN